MPPIPTPLRAERRRLRWWYAAIVVVLAAAVAATMAIVIGTGEAAHATLSTSAAAGPVPTGTVRSDPQVVWSTTDRPATGNPLSTGTVITWSDHQLSGRDAVSGEVRWYYRRTDATICDAAQSSGTAFVLFERDGNCDELSSFKAETGDRGWFRTLPDDGPGHIQITAANLAIVYPRSFHLLRIAQGYDVFNSAVQPDDCTITSASAGGGGILVAQRCGDGAHLALYANDGEKSEPKVQWRVASTASTVAVANDTMSAYTLDQSSLSRRQLTDGAIVSVPLPLTSGSVGPALTNAPTTVVQIGDGAAAFKLDGSVSWELRDVRGPASVPATTATNVWIATTTGASELDLTTGVEQATFRFATVDGARVYPAGAGLIVAGTTAGASPSVASSGSSSGASSGGSSSGASLLAASPTGLAYLR